MSQGVVIKNGVVIDGTGRPARAADVTMREGRITSVELGADTNGAQVIDADGRYVAPGFIDPHTHVDPQLWWDPFGLPLVLHGVTSVMTGNCGVTLAPCNSGDAETLATLFYQVEEVPLETLRSSVPWSWNSFAEYIDGLDSRLGINCAALVGHCAVRYSVMGHESLERAATPDEIGRMRELVRGAIRAGAIGFSTSQNKLHVGAGGVPIPSRWAQDDEIFALCDVLREEGIGVIQTDGGVDIAHRAEWVHDIGGPMAEQTGRPLLAGNVLPRFAASQSILDEIRTYQDRGVAIYAEASPSRFDSFFTLDGGTVSFMDIAVWRRIASMSHLERLEAFHDRAFRDVVHRESMEASEPVPWERIRIFKTVDPAHGSLVGLSVPEFASSLGVRIVDGIANLALTEDLQTQFVIEATSDCDANIASYLQSPQAILGASDAGAHIKTFCGGGNTSLVLSKWVRDTQVLPLEEGVRRMTSQPADVLGLGGRGRVIPGAAADIIVFDLDRISYETPRFVNDLPGGGQRLWHDATGFDHVLVNGRRVVSDGELTGELAGTVIRPERARQ